VLPSLVGPAISGLLAQHASWRWVFLGLVPFGVVGGVLLVPVLRGLSAPRRTGGLAGKRRVLWAIAVAAGIAGLEQAGQHPSVRAAVLAAAGVVVLAVGLRPLLPKGTFRVRPGVAAPVALRGLLAGTFFGVESLIPLSLSIQHGYGATAAGLPLAVSGFSWSAGSWWQGRVDDARYPRRRIALIRTGFVLAGVAAAGMAVTALPSSPAWLAYPSWLCAGLGAGLTMSSVSVLLLKYTDDDNRGADSAALQLSDATASALTTGFAGVLVAAAARGTIGDTAAFVTLDVAMCAVAAVGAAVAGRARPAGTG
jgi:MFS family permease